MGAVVLFAFLFMVSFISMVASEEIDASTPYGGRIADRGERSFRTAAGGFATDVEKFVLGSGPASYAVSAVGPTDTTPGGWMAAAHGARDAISLALPDGRCFHRQYVSATAANYSCRVATNAGFFNVSDGGCEGSVVVDGRVLQAWTTRRASIGRLVSGHFVAGYVAADDVHAMGFQWLVSGVGWLVRAGRSYVNESLRLEAFGKDFATLKAPRMAVGASADGRLLLFAGDGYEASKQGYTLWELADAMLSAGATVAINLDGGGSTTLVEHGVVRNPCSDPCSYPCEHCPVYPNRCARRVTSILCLA
jgi:hypothetical protein